MLCLDMLRSRTAQGKRQFPDHESLKSTGESRSGNQIFSVLEICVLMIRSRVKSEEINGIRVEDFHKHMADIVGRW